MQFHSCSEHPYLQMEELRSFICDLPIIQSLEIYLVGIHACTVFCLNGCSLNLSINVHI